MHLGLIGYGSIAAGLMAELPTLPVTQVTVLVRTGSDAQQRHAAMGIQDAPPARFVTGLDELLSGQPDLVVECAGHAALADFACPILASGHDLVIASVGALASAPLHDRVRAAARQGGSRLILPSGAIGGLDLLAILARNDAVDVTYRGIKPPSAWKGSPAEAVLDLDALDTAVTFFSGTGRQAALAYPKNANVVAALALAGADFDRMRVELVADPSAQSNRHTYEAVSPACRYEMSIAASGSSANARTSVTTVLSILHEIARYRPQS